MTRRRRRVWPDRLTAPDFLVGDGFDALFDGTPVLESRDAARREWERLRAVVWRLWATDPSWRPPMGAETHDELHGPADVAVFAVRRPAAAAAVRAELELWITLHEAELTRIAEVTAAAHRELAVPCHVVPARVATSTDAGSAPPNLTSVRTTTERNYRP